MKLKIIAVCLGMLMASNAMATSVCVLEGTMFGVRQSCDGAKIDPNAYVLLSGALQTLLTNGYKIVNVISDSAGELTYTLTK